jgi:hypothetical protein
MGIHPLVRDLYRRFLVIPHPLGRAYVRDRAKAAILANAHLKAPPRAAARVSGGADAGEDGDGAAGLRRRARRAVCSEMGASNEDEEAEDAFMRAVYKGRWWAKETAGVVQLVKFRALRRE